MIAIVPTIYAPLGPVLIRSVQSGTNLINGERRVSRTSTLDGGITVYHGGFSDADREILIVTKSLTRVELDLLVDYLRDYTELICYQTDGAYKVSAGSWSVDDDSLRVRFLVLENLSSE